MSVHSGLKVLSCGRQLMVQKYVATRHYAMKSSLPIKWVRPEKIPCINPAKSGDLENLKPIDKSLPPLEFRDIKELETASDTVKKIFSLEFFPYKKTVEALRSDYLGTVQRHIFDTESPEARVAKMTSDIRDMQLYMEKNPRDKRTKVRLKETIDKRKRLLKHLRTWDYKCFEWILDRLGLVYKPYPATDVYRRVERKRSLRMLTDQYCDDIVSQKLLNYRKMLESQQEDFLKEKIETLEWIMKEEAECGVPPTVTQTDVDKTKEQLEQLKIKRSQQNKEEV